MKRAHGCVSVASRGVRFCVELNDSIMALSKAQVTAPMARADLPQRAAVRAVNATDVLLIGVLLVDCQQYVMPWYRIG